MPAPILIVDDDPDIRESLGDMLCHEGYRVQAVPDGTEALQCVKRERYSAALLDIQLPDVDGLSVLKVMMELDPDLPIIILTGHASTENTIGSLIKGAFAYLTKPYNKQELTAVLRRAVSVKGLVVRAEHVEQALSASEQRFRALVESASDAIVLSDEGGHIIWWNAAAERLFAYPKYEALGRTLSMLIPERFRKSHEAGLARLAAGGEPRLLGRAIEMVGLRKDGTEFPLELSLARWNTKEGTFFSGIIRDITERKRAEDAVARLSHHNELILNSAGEGIFGLDLEGRVTFINPMGAQLLGWEPSQLIGQVMHMVVYRAMSVDSVPTKEACPVYSAIKDGGTHHIHNELFTRKDGTTFPVEYVTSAIWEQDRLVGAVVVFKNIAERNRMDALQQAQLSVSHILAEGRNLQDAMPQLLKATCDAGQWDLGLYWRMDAGSSALRCELAWHKPWAHEEEFYVVSRGTALPPGLDIPGRACAGREPVWVADLAEDPRFTRSPTATRVGLRSAAAFPLRTGDEVCGVIELFSREPRPSDRRLLHTMADIGMKIGQFIDREASDRALRVAHEETNRILASLPGAIFLCGDGYIVHYANELATAYFSTPDRSLIGQSLLDCLPLVSSARERFMRDFLEIRVSGEKSLLDKEFEAGKRIFRYRLFPVSVNQAAPCRVGIVLWDVTEEKEFQEQLMQTDKLASLGTMVSGMAHEINNPAQAILSMAELIQDEGDLTQIRQFAADIVEYARHVSNVVRDFASYARAAGRDGQTDLDVVDRLTEAVKMVRRGPHFGHVNVVTHYTGVAVLRARKAEVDQLFVNLISNAVQAMNGRGELTLSTRVEADMLFVSIGDTGCGIPRSIQARIFDPFFTTKEPGKGTGLGLSIVHRIVTKYGGAIAVESEEGKGTVFRIRFPLTAPA
jgi:PAS domain S-box-containing protein